jgi:hypothetical protein
VAAQLMNRAKDRVSVQVDIACQRSSCTLELRDILYWLCDADC